MRFTLAAVLALGTIHNSDAFLSPNFKLTTTDIRLDQRNVGALAAAEEDEDIDIGNQGGNRLKEMMELAKQRAAQSGVAATGISGPAIENPFLKPQAPSNPGDLSVEEQARMFREMMAGQQPAAPAPMQRVPNDPGGGRPAGRNPDADKIANTSDLYFAQLKRDSTVRTMARIQGDDEKAQKVFEDKGIKELDNLLLTNPYLKGRQEEEKKLLDNVPDEIIAPYFRSDEMAESERMSAGVSYKQKLEERRKKKGGAAPAPAAPAPKAEVAEVAPVVEPTPPAPEPEPEPEPVVAEVSTPPPVEQEVVVPQASATPPLPTPQEAPAPVVEEPRPVTVTSSDDVRQQNLRTFMGLILKHRGGPGFGKGRLKGPDVDLFEGLVEELTNMLKDEAQNALPSAEAVSATPAVVEATPVPAAPVVSTPEPAPAASASAEPANIDSTIACIEGAITMYNNSPPAIRDSVLVTLRAALQAAVDTCNVALPGQPAPPVGASADASIEGMVACIEGAVTMYKNSPPALKDSVLVTLRMALMSAVETCNVVLSGGAAAAPAAVATPPPAVQAPPAAQPVAPVAAAVPEPPPPAPAAPVELDRNSKALEKLYDIVQSASGDGKLGLRSDLTADEASALADELVGMRGILMGELEAGIPEPGEEAPEPAKAPKPPKEPVSETSTASKYQQMLAKARAEKANA